MVLGLVGRVFPDFARAVIYVVRIWEIVFMAAIYVPMLLIGIVLHFVRDARRANVETEP